MKKILSSKIDIIIPLAVLLFSFVVAYFRVGDGIINYIDHSFPFYFSDHLRRLFYAWNDYIYMGYNHSISLISTAGYYCFFLIFEKAGLGYVALNRLEHVIAVFSSIYFTYLFLASLFRNKLSFFHKIVILLCSTFILTNILSESLFTMGVTQQVCAFSGVPLALWGLRRYLISKKIIYILPVIAASFFVASFNLPYSIISILAVIIFVGGLNDVVVRDRIKGVGIFLVLWAGINFYWILPMFYSLFIEPPFNLNEVINSKEELRDVLFLASSRYTLNYLFQLSSNLEMIMRQNNEPALILKYLASFVGIAVSYLAIIVLFVKTFFASKDNRATKSNFPYSPFFLVSILLLFVFFAKGLSAPFGDFYLVLFEKSNIFKMFRDSFKWIFISTLSFVILASNILINSRGRKAKFILVAFFVFYLFPWSQNLFGRLKAYDVPNYYFEFREKYEKQLNNGDKRAIILDSREGPVKFKFDVKNESKKKLTGNILKFISPLPVLDLFSNGSGISFYYIEDTLNKLVRSDRDLPLFQELGVTHVFHQLDNEESQEYHYSDTYFDKEVFGDLEVYAIKKDYILPKIFLSKVQSDDAPILKFWKKSPVKYIVRIENIKSSADINFLYTIDKNWKIFPEKFNGYATCNDSDKYKITSKNSIGLNVGNNLEIYECVNKKEEFSLNDIKYLWKKSEFEESHRVSQFYNEWTIDPEVIKKNFPVGYYAENKGGGIDMEFAVYFNVQSYYYIGIIVSGVFLVGVILFVIIRKKLK